MDAPELVPFVRSVAEDMQKAGIQWRLDPAYLIQLCDLYAHLAAENERLRQRALDEREACAQIADKFRAEASDLNISAGEKGNRTEATAYGSNVFVCGLIARAIRARAALTGGSDGE